MGYSYVILTNADITKQDFDDYVQNDIGSLRTSKDATPSSVLKYLGVKPRTLGESVTVYSHTEVLVELAKPGWVIEDGGG